MALFQSAVQLAQQYYNELKQKQLPAVTAAVQQGVQRVGKAIGSQPLINTPTLLGLNAPTQKPVIGPTIGQYAQQRIAQPIQQGVKQIQQPGLQNKIGGAFSIASGGFSAIPSPTSAAYNIGVPAIAGAMQALRTRQPLLSTVNKSILNPTSSVSSTGLGIQNPVLATGLDVALTRNPKSLAQGVKTIAQGLKGYSPRAFDIHPQDQEIMGNFINTIQTGGAKGNLGQLGKDAQAIAEHYIGKKAIGLSNEKLAKVFDALLSSSARKNGEDALQTPFPKMGFVGGNQASKGLPGEVPQDIRGALTGAANIKERGFITSVKDAKNTPQGVKDIISGSYVVKSNKQLKADALKLIRSDPTSAEQLATNPRNATDVQIGHELVNHFGSVGNFDKAGQITEGMANSGTEFGQAIQAFSQYDKTTPSGALKYAQSKIGEYNKKNPNAKLSVTSDQVKGIFDKAQSIQVMPQGRERNIASHELMQVVNNLIPSTIADKAITVWKAGLLTSLRTTERNLVGNTVHGVAEIAKDIPATVTDKLLSLRTGQRTLTPTLQGAGGGVKQGLQSAKDIIKTGYDPEEAISKYDVRHITWKNNPVEQGLKKYTDIVFRSLGAQDKPYWNAAHARSLYDQAGAEAINAGKKGDQGFIESLVKNPNEQMLINATKDANTATFHDKTMLSQIANNFKQAASKNEYTKVASEVIAPFTGVPSSVAKQMMEYSPLGLIKGIATAGKVAVKNVPDLQRQASQEVGRGVIGTGLLGVGAYLASKGLITGQPKDPKEAAQWQLEGKQANSVLIGGKWRSIGSIGPEALVALAGAKAQEELKKPDASVGGYAANIGKDFLGQTFLQGVQQPLAAVNDPARYGPSYIGNQASSVVPNIVKDTAKAFDPTQRESNNIQDYMTNAVPGLRNQNIPKRDNLGNEMPQEPTGAGAYLDLFNSKTPISNPVVDELARLNNAGQNATPTKLTKSQTVNGEKMSLTPKQLDALESQSGAQTKQALETLFQSSGYQSLSDEEKATAANNVIASTRKSVKTNIDLSNPTTTPDSTMSKAVTQQAVGSQEKQATITKISDMLLDSSVDAQKKTLIVQTLQKNKGLFTQVKNEIRDRQSGLTSQDKAIRSLSTSQRATYIIGKIRSAQSSEEKVALFKGWAAKGIINKTVINEMKSQALQQ